MAEIEDVARIARELPEVAVGVRHGNVTWSVGGKAFAWERPFSKADLRRFGATPPPEGPIVAVRVADLVAKESLLATASDAFFTIPHFDGYPAVLIQLPRVAEEALRSVLVEGWLACAPPRLADTFVRNLKPISE
jgi:hypothetical protein